MKHLKLFETTSLNGDPIPNYDEMISFIEIYKKSVKSIFNKTCGKDMELEIIQEGYYNYPMGGYISFPRHFTRIWGKHRIQKDIIKDFSIIIRLNINFKASYMEENSFKGKKTGKTIDAFYLKSKLTYHMLENMKTFLDALKNKNFIHRHEIGLRYNKIDIKMLYNPKDLRQKTKKVMKDINEDVIKDTFRMLTRQTISEKASEIKKFLKNSDIPYTKIQGASGNIYFILKDQNILNKEIKIVVKPSEITCKYIEYIEQSRRWRNKPSNISIRISYDEIKEIARFIAENFPNIIPKKNINKVFNDMNEGMYDFMHENTLDGLRDMADSLRQGLSRGERKPSWKQKAKNVKEKSEEIRKFLDNAQIDYVERDFLKKERGIKEPRFDFFLEDRVISAARSIEVYGGANEALLFIFIYHNRIDLEISGSPRKTIDRDDTNSLIKFISENLPGSISKDKIRNIMKGMNEGWFDVFKPGSSPEWMERGVRITENANKIRKKLKKSGINFIERNNIKREKHIYFAIQDESNISRSIQSIHEQRGRYIAIYVYDDNIELAYYFIDGIKKFETIDKDDMSSIVRFIVKYLPESIPQNKIVNIMKDINESYFLKKKDNIDKSVEINKRAKKLQTFLDKCGINKSMEKRKIDNVNKVIQYTMDVNAMDRWRPVQMNIINKERNEDLIRFCEIFSKETKIEELGGMRREPSDKSFDFVASKANAGIGMSGIKVNHFPQMEIWEWEKWDGGFIEVFLRTDESYFIWQYVPMKHLREILTEFQDDFIFWDYYNKPYE